MKKYLDDGADPYLPWYNNYNALQNACMMGDDELVEILLMEQVDPNKFIEHQRTYYSSKPMLDDPLWIAVSKDKKRIFSMLLYKGAEIRESQNRFQRYSTLPEFIIFHYRNDKDAEQLCAFLKLLVQHKWEINHINRRGKTILFSALEIFIPREVVRGDIIRFLLKNGADPRIRCNGIEPIQMARSPYVRKIFEDERR